MKLGESERYQEVSQDNPAWSFPVSSLEEDCEIGDEVVIETDLVNTGVIVLSQVFGELGQRFFVIPDKPHAKPTYRVRKKG